MPLAAPRSTAVTCRPPPTPRASTGGVRPGPTRSSRTTLNSAWACGRLSAARVRKSVGMGGGDGGAYDTGYGGLDHVLASGRKVNVLVLDTGVYSNTGGQASKATPRAAVAKFASGGKNLPRKDLGAITLSYGNIYVAQVAYGANMTQLVKAFQEADAYPGPALIIAYSYCLMQAIDFTTATVRHKEAE